MMTRKTRLVFLFSIFFSTFSYAQSTEAIRVKLRKAIELSSVNMDSALLFVQPALLAARQLDSSLLIYKALRIEGSIYEDNNRLQDAKRSYGAALYLAEKKLPKQEQLEVFSEWAIIHKKLGQYAVAEEYNRRIIAEAEQMGNWEMVEIGYHSLGTMYASMGNFEKCIAVYFKSIEAAEKWGNAEGVVVTYQNISNNYYKVKNYEMAQQTIAKTYKMALKFGDSARISAVLRVYSTIESALGNKAEALKKLNTALAISEKLGDKARIADIYSAIGYVYQEQNDNNKAAYFFAKCDALTEYMPSYILADFLYKKGNLMMSKGLLDSAVVLFKQSIGITDSLGFVEIAHDDHLALSRLFERKDDYPQAFFHLSKANQLSDTLFEAGRQKLMTEEKFKYDTEKRNLELASQTEKLQQSQRIWQILLVALGVTLGLLFFTWRQMKAKQKAQKHAELLMQELHHRVKNNLQTVTSIMRLQARGITDPAVALVIAESRSRLETISMIHQQLYSDENVQSLNFKHFVGDLVEKLQFTYSLCDKPLTIELDIPDTQIEVDIALPLGLIFNELLTNSFKYAYAEVAAPKLVVKLDKHRFYFADNGMGSADKMECVNNRSFGLQLIHSLSQQLRGKCRFYNDNGLAFELVFDK
jgi:two-component system, sensor histidine kinase PdtaS